MLIGTVELGTAAYSGFGPPTGRTALGWGIVLALVILAIVGEVVESAASAWGAARAGASRRASVLAVVGSLVGSIVGALAGTPVPVVGWIVGAILFAALGAMLGAVLGEGWKGRPGDVTWRVGVAAFWGRVFGAVGKLAIVTTMVAIVVLGVVF